MSKDLEQTPIRSLSGLHCVDAGLINKWIRLLEDYDYSKLHWTKRRKARRIFKASIEAYKNVLEAIKRGWRENA